MSDRLDMDDVRRVAKAMADAPRVVLDMHAFEALTLIGQVQLALRHPAVDPSADIAEIARNLIVRIATQLPAECMPIVEAGAHS